MTWFSGSIASEPITTFVKAFTRDGSVCEVSYGAVLDVDTRLGGIQPAQTVEIDVDNVRWFTGYVVSSTIQRSAGQWVNRVVCDHKSLKRLRDYYWSEGDFHIENNTVNRVIDLAMDRAGAVYAIDSALQPAFSEIEIPPYTWSNGMSAYDVVLDCAVFGMVQINPLPDGSLFLQKMRPTTFPTDITNRSTFHERRVDDAYFRTAALVLGWATEAAFVSGSSPYGYPRTMVVANPHLISGGPVLQMAEQLLQEYNKLVVIAKDTIPTRERMNLGDSFLYKGGWYDEGGLVMRNSVNASREGFVQTITTGEKCPKIFGFEPMQPPPIVKKDVVIVMTHNQLARSLNFFTATTGSLVEWENIGGGIAADYLNFVVADTGDAYLTNWDGSTASSGLWHMSNIATGTGWDFVMSKADMMAPAVVGGAIIDAGTAMACTSDGTVYLPVSTDILDSNQRYWFGSSALSFTSKVAAIGGTAFQRPFATTCDNGVDVICGREHPFVAVASYINLVSGATRDAYSINVIASTTTHYAAGTYGSSDDIFAIADGSAFQSGHQARSQILEEKDSGHVFWLRYADGYLMQDGIVQAIPNDVGVDAGVFSGSGGTSGGAGMDTVYGYGQIIWVASTAAATNTKCSIGYTENGGVTWLPKDGNFNTIFPAGYSANTSNVQNIVRFVAV